MSTFVKLDNQRVVAIITAEAAPDESYTLVPETSVVPIQTGPTLLFVDGQFVWSDTRTLSAVKAVKRAKINEWRASANESTFPFAGKLFQCDRLSRGDIDGVNGWVSITGILPSNFPGAWKALDNSYTLIPDVETWIDFYGAMIAQGTANFSRAQALKTYLDSSAVTTIAEVEAIHWNMEI